jgi:hypothetical protein
MLEDDSWTESDECDYIYYRLWLSGCCVENRNCLRWLYDDD